jgi:ribosomal protein S4E
MASIQNRNDSYRVIFKHHGQQHFVPLGKVSEHEAEARSVQVECLLIRIKQGLIELLAGVGIVLSDGKPPATRNVDLVRGVAKATTLATLRDNFIVAR